jgi:antitoxin ParD1/3/4
MIIEQLHIETKMTTIRKTITITDQQDDWIKSRIAAGEFTNDSEYIRDLIRRDQARFAEIEAIREALIEGEESGISDRTPQEVREAVKKRLRKNGQLPLKKR